MNIYTFAEKILSSPDLESKLVSFDSIGLSGDCPISVPDVPARIDSIRPGKERNPFPRLKDIESIKARAEMFHSFANHELQAIELLAYAILKFDVDDVTRMNWYRTLKDEQKHFRLYEKRLKDWGYLFGSFPVNANFWDQISLMDTPVKFMNIFSLVFEQANLDFSSMYREVFKRIHDEESADILNTVFLDEINHVRHGVQCLKKWMPNSVSMWSDFLEMMDFPISPRRARGPVFHANARRKTGLDDNFISNMEKINQKFDQSRIYIPNLNLEEQFINKFGNGLAEEKIWSYLFYLPTQKNDFFVSKNPNSLSQEDWKQLGLSNGKVISPEEVKDISKYSQVIPWGWHEVLISQYNLSERFPHPQLESIKKWNSKVNHQIFAAVKNMAIPGTRIAKDWLETSDMLNKYNPDDEIIIKSNFACSGRNRIKNTLNNITEKEILWIKNQLMAGGVVIQPYLKDYEVLSAQCHIDSRQRIKFYGLTHSSCHPNGSTKVIRRFPTKPVLNELFEDSSQKIASCLIEDGYYGPFSFDGLVTPQGVYTLMDLNIRYSVGRILMDISKLFPETVSKSYVSMCFFNHVNLAGVNYSSFRAFLKENMFVLSPESLYPKHISVLIVSDDLTTLLEKERLTYTFLNKKPPETSDILLRNIHPSN